MGLPIVTTASGTNHEAVRLLNLRTAGTPAALAPAFSSMLRDPAGAARIGAENRRLAQEEHDLATQTRALGAAFDEAEQWPARARRRGGDPHDLSLGLRRRADEERGADAPAVPASIRSQTYPSVELVVVDNFSTDQTFRVAQELADIAVQAGPERSAQRNLGIELATGEYILWIDADMVLTPHVVADAVAAAEREDATAVFIPEQTVGQGSGPPAERWNGVAMWESS